MAIQLITDSTSYIPDHIVQAHNIAIVPLSSNFNDESFLDIPSQFTSFYEKLRSVDYIPKSSQPSVSDIYEAFERAVKKGDQVIGTFLSSKMSGTYSTACMIKEQLLEAYPEAQIQIIDSASNCMQLGLCVLAGAKAIKEGKSFEVVLTIIEATKGKTRFIFSPDTLEYLRRGGRIGTAGAFMGQLLQVKPILTVCDGETTSLDKVRTRKKSIQYLTDTFLKDIQKRGLENVVIHHIEALGEAEKLKKSLEDKCELENIEIVSIGPVIGTHVGPGAIGIAYEMVN